MSVAKQLGLNDDRGLLGQARGLWGQWVAAAPLLGVVTCLADLRPWLRTADPVSADRVLRELARLGSVTGGDSAAAAGVLAWALLPGACSLAGRLGRLSPRIDEVVAAQLWIEVRAFPWERLGKVAANILLNTRTGVLQECGVYAQLQRTDRTWSRTLVIDPHSPTWEEQPARALGSGAAAVDPSAVAASAAEELVELLDWACAAEVITDADRSLLVSLVQAADRADTRRTGRGRGGLMANDVSQVVGDRCGVSATTVRRRTRRTVQALTTACGEGRFAA